MTYCKPPVFHFSQNVRRPPWQKREVVEWWCRSSLWMSMSCLIEMIWMRQMWDYESRLGEILCSVELIKSLATSLCFVISIGPFFLEVSVTNESPAVIDTTSSVCLHMFRQPIYADDWFVKKTIVSIISHMNTNQIMQPIVWELAVKSLYWYVIIERNR